LSLKSSMSECLKCKHEMLSVNITTAYWSRTTLNWTPWWKMISIIYINIKLLLCNVEAAVDIETTYCPLLSRVWALQPGWDIFGIDALPNLDVKYWSSFWRGNHFYHVLEPQFCKFYSRFSIDSVWHIVKGVQTNALIYIRMNHWRIKVKNVFKMLSKQDGFVTIFWLACLINISIWNVNENCLSNWKILRDEEQI
jgi:hypothetical protein